ncbi:glutamate--cysteine ligase [Homoserinibacter sp. YIM 151385]|uniref:glutamate--cysteine ligase n=1 Tax=Homoserinibacter sp. YIM 151385 TaxID=2985506 RepID=UPI0022F04447|nr:glutamate--cysteine ligase [Homoserinibacter sp. YIM 151385]WBU39183.1 glutamate--cysteine ligase [Homoserinibacter sp. YIM 151385]
MGIDFSPSAQSSVGIEWELLLVDQETGAPVGIAPQLLEELGSDTGRLPHITGEFLTNTVEIVSAPHARVADAVHDLAELTATVREAAAAHGAQLMGAGTHPFAEWRDAEVTPGSPRYETLVDRTQWWGRQLLIWGVHMHIGLDDREKVLPVLGGLLTSYPHFQALSASSPFWTGADTGYASNRALMFQQLPTAGLPPQLGAWANYEELVADLTHVGVIDDHSELRWDVRPSPKWGTIELRYCDGLSTLREVGALTALAQCLVEELSRDVEAGRDIPQLQPWYVRENKWRGARYGLDAIVIVNSAGDERLVTDDLRDMLERLAPIAEQLDCAAELADIELILERGASYQRQRRVFESSGEDAAAVVRSLVAEFATGEPATS